LGVRLLGLALIIFSVVVATYLLVAYFAIESGRAERVTQEATSHAEQIGRQVELARDDLAEGSDNLALTRLEWVLAQDANNAEALALREQTPLPPPRRLPRRPIRRPKRSRKPARRATRGRGCLARIGESSAG
jgi:Flp pilus assembly protein CpaB